MKKELLYIVYLLIVIGLIPTTICLAASSKQHLLDNSISQYQLDYNTFEKFIKNPNVEALIHINNCENVLVDDSVYNQAKIKNMLENYNITEDVSERHILCADNVPVTIWIKIKQSYYFITVDEKDEDLFDKETNDYIYRLYTHSEYYNKFGTKNASLIVNNEDITLNNYVKIRYSDGFIPLRATLEKMGIDVEWNDSKKVAEFCYNGTKYTFNPETGTLVNNETNLNLLLMPPGGTYYYTVIIDGRIIINDSIMKVIGRIIGAEIAIDYSMLKINIEKK